MTDRPRRHGLRLPGYDYGENGAYFVTICTRDRSPLLGTRHSNTISLNGVGTLVQHHWDALPTRFPGLTLDAHIVLPDHLHGILWLQQCEVTLGRIVGAFKSLTVKAYKEDLRWAPHVPTLWQRNYYEHVIRNEGSLERIREYIVYNAAKGGQFSPP